MFCYKKITLGFSIISTLNLYSMEALRQGSRVWMNRLPDNHLIKLPDAFIKKSTLITTNLEEFEGKGTKENPLEMFIEPVIDNFTLRNFIHFQTPYNSVERGQFLSLACYFSMPQEQRKFGYEVRKTLKNLPLSKALQHAEELQKLSLPPSFLSMLTAKKLTELFVKVHPPVRIEEKSDNQKNREDKIIALSDKITYFYITQNLSNFLSWDHHTIKKVLSNGIPVALCRNMDNPQELHYFYETMQQPVVLQHDARINRYAMNAQANSIVFYDRDGCVGLFHTTQNISSAQDSDWKKSILGSSTNNNYFKIIFSKNNNLFITLSTQNNTKEIPLMLEIKVWDTKTTRAVAHYSLPAQEKLSSINFYSNDTQLILHINHAHIKVFDISTQSISEEWYDAHAACPCSSCKCYISEQSMEESSEASYHLSKHPVMLYDHVHHRLIEFTKELLQPDGKPSSSPLSLRGRITDDNAIILTIDNGYPFIFDLPTLDVVLQAINTLTLTQAVTLMFLPQSLDSQNEAIEILRPIAEKLPRAIKDLIGKCYSLTIL